MPLRRSMSCADIRHLHAARLFPCALELIETLSRKLAKRQSSLRQSLDVGQPLEVSPCVDPLAAFGAPRLDRCIAILPFAQSVHGEPGQPGHGTDFQGSGFVVGR